MMSFSETTVELPPPLSSQTGWPFDTSRVSPDISAEELALLPAISIVTPSYQQGPFIEQTIRSILLQGYPKLQYIIMDGGSSDETVKIIKYYAEWVDYWESARDKGQTDAIIRGWSKATGTLVAWLNSDDWYVEGALLKVGRAYVKNRGANWIMGAVQNYKLGVNTSVITPKPMSLTDMMGSKNYCWHQPGMFWTKALIDEMGPLREDLHMGMDHEFFLRCLKKGHQPVFLEDILTVYRIHLDAKSTARIHEGVKECKATAAEYRSMVSDEEYKLIQENIRAMHAEYLIKIANGFKARGQRGKALGYLLEHAYLIPHIQPMGLKQYIGALFRTAFR